MASDGPTTLGLDVGGTAVKLAVMRGGAVVWTGRTPTYNRPTAGALTAAIRAALAEGPDVAFDAVGLCVPGLLDAGRTRVELSVNLPALMDLTLVDLVSRCFGRPPARLEVLNDAVAGGIDLAAARGLAGRLLVLAIGTGVGMAVLDDGRPLLVEGTTPGHIGQVDVSLPGEPVIGPDGGAGSLEGYLGAPALAARYGDGGLENMPGDGVPVRALARAIRICHAIYRPQHVALIGGIGIRLARVLPTLRGLIECDLTSVARPGWTLACGEDDFHSARGAAMLAARVG